MAIISTYCKKGGVGKTTSCVNISAQIANKGKKVLMIDMDPQGNATSGFGIDKDDVEHSVYDVLINGVEMASAIIHTKYKNMDVCPSNIQLSGAEIELSEVENREFVLKNALSEVKDNYDFIIIDCPPSLSLLTVNAFAAAGSVLIPIQCEYYALEGLSQLVHTIKLIRKGINTKPERAVTAKAVTREIIIAIVEVI